ncbi:FAD-dependent oxidoreductase [Polynucleobacter sp. es-GGE-1]|uniref:1-hydroxycarotenoid 3,4-desaturase CrtD n=1 Tax=Polynucleobacter sp. es-GGE-1 TaxID=1819724 RepID=UPI001C0C586F|nr:1-hydroxycarotenoid 3,4-desaturase CrtD [Polynucleobacter sp. es-GGE-1]MBU3634958.1 FAD-dependent oxidoreductase [Polynucleobacter sp. es-GGE-1]
MPSVVGRVALLAKAPVVIIGGGIGGLTCALDLASSGVEVILIEKESQVGGKIRQLNCSKDLIKPALIDSGPTVFTMRWVFDALFQKAGTSLESELKLEKLNILARHAWSKDERLDLFSDVEQSAQAIAAFSSPAEAKRFLQFSDQCRRLYKALEKPYMLSAKPNFAGMISDLGMSGSKVLYEIGLFNNLWKSLGNYFNDPRLRQLFGRYATYCGSSPYQAPATLMLIADVEAQGVWALEGGMYSLVKTIRKLAEAKGVQFLTGQACEEILLDHGRISGVRLTDGTVLHTESVVFNGDLAALQTGLLNSEGSKALSAKMIPPSPAKRSLSAITWSMNAKTDGLPLVRHNVFFNQNYHAEFDDIFSKRRLPVKPTVYVCAQDQSDVYQSSSNTQRLLCLVNAPANGDQSEFNAQEIDACEHETFGLLQQCGLNIDLDSAICQRTTPSLFNQLFPGTGGALYGQANHGWMKTFGRASAQSPIPGLYLAGGSVHPGPGVPMAALSGRMAAATLMDHLGLIKLSGRTLISGGTSTL